MRRLALLLLAACSAPANLPSLAEAERLADRGQTDEARAAYRAAKTDCHAVKPPRRQQLLCSQSYLGAAEVEERAGNVAGAIAMYAAVPAELPGDPVSGAIALYRAGKLQLPTDAPAAWTLLWRAVTDFPDEPSAADALADLLADGRGRDPHALADQLARVLTAVTETQLADNLLWSLADLDAHELANPAAALALYDRIPTDYPDSGLRDDARWLGANLARSLGDGAGCATRLRGLLATREVSYGTGSYFSIWLDDAQLLLGQVLRDDLHDLPGAAAAFRRLPKDYPASILRDDALYELAVTLAQANDHLGACRAVAALVELEPDSKYVGRARVVCPP